MIKLELTQEELNTLVSLLDAGVKAAGLQAVKAAAVLVGKIEDAANAPTDNVIDFGKDEVNG